MSNVKTFKQRVSELLAEIAKTAVAEELRILLSGEASVKVVVGARIRAIHDLQLQGERDEPHSSYDPGPVRGLAFSEPVQL